MSQKTKQNKQKAQITNDVRIWTKGTIFTLLVEGSPAILEVNMRFLKKLTIVPPYNHSLHLPQGFQTNTSQRSLMSTEPCSQKLGYRTNLSAQKQRNRQGECGMYTMEV